MVYLLMVMNGIVACATSNITVWHFDPDSEQKNCSFVAGGCGTGDTNMTFLYIFNHMFLSM
jgi:hypothetical protein